MLRLSWKARAGCSVRDSAFTSGSRIGAPAYLDRKPVGARSVG